MSKKIVPKKEEIFIHVKAESEILSVNAIFPEKKVEKILTEIRDNFCKLDARTKGDNWLKVSTCVHNPTLFSGKY